MTDSKGQRLADTTTGGRRRHGKRTSTSRKYMATGSKSTRSSLPYVALLDLRLLAFLYLDCQAVASGVTASCARGTTAAFR
jgi:hypothetical protein